MEDFQFFRNTVPFLTATFILLMNFADRWSILARFCSPLVFASRDRVQLFFISPGVSNKASSQLCPGLVMNQRQARGNWPAALLLENTQAPNLKNNRSASVAGDGGQNAFVAPAVSYFPNLQSKPFKLWKHAA